MRRNKGIVGSQSKGYLLKSGFYGSITALAFAPFNVFPIFLLTFARLFVRILEIKDIKSLLKEVFCFFFCMHVACLYWIVYPLSLNLSKHWILIPIAITLIPTYFSMFLLIPVWIMWKRTHGNSLQMRNKFTEYAIKPVMFASLFNLIMLFYGHFFPGFPWLLPGYVWCCHEIFLQTLSVYGIYGLSFITMLIAGFGGLSFVQYKLGDIKKSKNSAIISTILFLFIVLFGYNRLANHKTEFTDKKIRVVQCNISQKNKSNSRLAFFNLQEHVIRSQHESKLDFVVWPEASVPYLYRENFEQLNHRLKSILNDGEYLLAGAVREDLNTQKIHNSVIVINHKGQNIANYNKSRLLPFGEYIPFRRYVPLKSIASDIGDFDAGTQADIFKINGMKIIFAICYEIAFPNGFMPYVLEPKITNDLGLRVNQEADLIVNITNDGWFGLTTEPFQHLQISRTRAIETGLPLVRATNYGISAIFDAYGREISRIPIDQAGVIDANIPKKTDCPFNRIDGNFWIALGLFLLTLLSMGIEIKNKNSNTT
ncbi:MAG: apolipoprotein N-acyltransferase [Holosporaceae bacterium]|jgi:apolipoprotein N-acyltransferase|nr:apolipoprotein N-acyltransferase [Holosporaceae bacterium]